MLFAVVATALWAILPAYVPNNAAVLVGSGPPLDGGRTWRGRRLLGDGKTWRGTGGGVAAGVAVALVLDAVRPSAAAALSVTLPDFPLAAAVALAAGAMAGDLAASLLKRRLGRKRGAPLPLVDQLDFVAGALAFAALAAPAWFGATFTAPVLAVVVVVTPVLHLGTNAAAYLLGLKDEPY
jgi:CDP-2,3-bis-(O-geranylgeranyl)-sn-glycerol synthase